MLKLPDIRQTNHYATPVFGADSDYTFNPPSFTNNGNGTTADNVTGLIRQRVDSGEMTWTNALPTTPRLIRLADRGSARGVSHPFTNSRAS